MKTPKAITIFLAGLIAGGVGPSAALMASAAVGDAIYEAHPESVCITKPQAACFANCAIAAGGWTGAAADMLGTSAQVVSTDECADGYQSTTRGLKTAELGDVPVGSRVHGVVE